MCTHCTCGHGHADAGDEGQVVAGVHSVPHGRQQEGGGGGVDGTALVAHPEEHHTRHLEAELSIRMSMTTLETIEVWVVFHLFSQRDVWIFQLSKKLLKLVAN